MVGKFGIIAINLRPMVLLFALMIGNTALAEPIAAEHSDSEQPDSESTVPKSISVIDDLGIEVRLNAPAKRIVSLAPHLTEILFSLGVGTNVIATVKYSDYPEQAKEIPQLGDAFSLNIEAVLALKPDVILAWHTGGINRPIERLKSLGIPVYVNESKTLKSIGDGIARIGKLVGVPTKGKRLQAQFSEALETTKVNNTVQPRVFFQISDQDLYTVNNDHLIGQAISHCGGTNLFADIQPKVALVSQESVVAMQPDVILLTQVPGSKPSSWVSRWQRYEGFSQRIKMIDPNLISRPSFRMLEGIRALCSKIVLQRQ